MKTLLLALLLMAVPAHALTPDEFKSKVEGLWLTSETIRINTTWVTVHSYFEYFTSMRQDEKSFSAFITRDNLPKYQLVTVSTEQGNLPVVVREWINGVPTTIWKCPNQKFLNIIGEVET